MNRVKTLLEPFLANQSYGAVIRTKIDPTRVEEIASGEAKIAQNEADLIETATDGQVNSALLMQLNADDLGSRPQKKEKPTATKTSKSPSVSMRDNPPKRRDW